MPHQPPCCLTFDSSTCWQLRLNLHEISLEYLPWMCFPYQLTAEGQKGPSQRIAFSYSSHWFFPSCGMSVLTAEAIVLWSAKYIRRIMARDTATDIRLYGLIYNIIRQFIMLVTSLVKGPQLVICHLALTGNCTSQEFCQADIDLVESTAIKGQGYSTVTTFPYYC